MIAYPPTISLASTKGPSVTVTLPASSRRTVVAVNMKTGDQVTAASSTENIVVQGAGGYEVTRALFEAYIGHSKDRANPSTGIIYWQLNKAWPSLQWQLYGSDFDQSGVLSAMIPMAPCATAFFAFSRPEPKWARCSEGNLAGAPAR